MLYLGFVVTLLVATFSQSSYPNFNDSDIATIRGYFEKNIGVSAGYQGKNPYTGCLVASLSQVDPTYYYTWQRDASVSMNVLRFTANSSDDYDKAFQNYITWVTKVQTASDPNGINVLGEPKFYVDGTVYDQGWCRPQNDGPATRSYALNMYSQWLISEGNDDLVQSYGLYTPGSNSSSIKDDTCDVEDDQKIDCGYVGITQDECENQGCCWEEIDDNPNNYPWCYYKGGSGGGGPTGLIPTDLNYVSLVWSNPGNNCDLWEEVRGPQFYTYMVQYQALKQGAVLATHYGDTDTASSWSSTASSVCEAAQAFDNNGFISEQQRQYDCSVILGPLYGGDSDCFPPTNNDVLSTAGQIADTFSSYLQVNSDDDNVGLPGVLLGRYTSDTYPGCNSNGGSQGHAWILCSNALGDLYYRNSMDLFDTYTRYQKKEITEGDLENLVGHEKLKIISNIVKKDFSKSSIKLHNYALLWKNGELNIEDKLDAILLAGQLMAGSGDGQLTRVKYHTSPCDNHMSEQICETTGEEVGAYDLTWSYGTVLSAWYYRGQAMNYGFKPTPFEIDITPDMYKKGILKQPSCQSGCTAASGLSSDTCCAGQC